MIKEHRHNRDHEKGTTLVEAIVTILVLSIGVIPAFSVVLYSNGLASSIKNNFIAANLAQEGLEVVRAIRDANWFQGNSFDTGLGDGNYRAIWSSTSLTSLPGNSNQNLKIDSQGLYNYSTGTDTIFRRRMIITKIDPTGCNCELRIVAEVSWQEKGRTTTIRAESHLFNWK